VATPSHRRCDVSSNNAKFSVFMSVALSRTGADRCDGSAGERDGDSHWGREADDHSNGTASPYLSFFVCAEQLDGAVSVKLTGRFAGRECRPSHCSVRRLGPHPKPTKGDARDARMRSNAAAVLTMCALGLPPRLVISTPR